MTGSELGLVLLILVAGTIHGAYLWLSVGPPWYDELRMLHRMEDALDRIESHPLGGLVGLATLGNTHPPGVPISYLPVYAVSGRDYRFTKVVSVFYLMLAMVGCYLLGRRFQSAGFGLFLAALFAVAPFAFQFTRHLLLEGPLAASLCFALYFALRSEGLSRRGFSFLFGLTAGWMLLIKWTAFLFLAGPALIACLEGWRRPGSRWLGGAGLALLGACIAAPWYAVHFRDVLDFVQFNEASRVYPEGWQPFATRTELSSLLYYPFALDDILGTILTGSVFIGLVLFCVDRRSRTRPAAYAIAVAAPAVVGLTFLISKESRHLRPAAVAFLWIGAGWMFGSLAPGRLRVVACAGLLVGCLAFGLLPAAGLVPREPCTLRLADSIDVALIPSTCSPERERWPHEEAIERIVADLRTHGKTHAAVLVLPFFHRLNESTYRYLVRRSGRPLRIHRAPDRNFDMGILNRADYLITTNLPGRAVPAPPLKPCLQVTRWLLGDIAPGPPPQLEEIASYRLPNRLSLLIYRRTGRLDTRSLSALADAIRAGQPRFANPYLGVERGRSNDPGDDGAHERRVIDGTRLRIWRADAGARKVVVELTASKDVPLRLEASLHGTPGARFQLVAGRHRVRDVYPFGTSVIGNPRVVRKGVIDPSGRVEVRLDPRELGPFGDGPVYLQAIVVGDETGLSNWVAFALSSASAEHAR